MGIAPIETRRVRLRALTDDDVDDVFAILGDERTTASVSWRQPSRESTAAWVARRVEQEHELGVSMWGVVRLDQGDLIGLCGFLPDDRTTVELGYVIHASHWGHGYGAESVGAALKAARRAGLQVWASIRSTNAASLAVARKVNLVEQDQVIQDDRGTLLIFRAG